METALLKKSGSTPIEPVPTLETSMSMARLNAFMKYESVRVWFSKIKKEKTQLVYLRALELLVGYSKLLNPDKIIEMAESKDKKVWMELDKILGDWYNAFLPKRGYPKTTCDTYYGSIQSFLKKNHCVTFERPQSSNPIIRYDSHEFQFTQQDVRDMLQTCKFDDLRSGVIALSSQAGQRRSILAYLRVGQLRQLWTITDAPIVVSIPSDMRSPRDKIINKNQVDYHFAFLQDCAAILRKIRPVAPDKSENDSLFWEISPDHVNDIVKEAAEKIGIQRTVKTKFGREKAIAHHHVFRSYLKSRMRKASARTGDPTISDNVFLKFLEGEAPQYAGAYDRYDEDYVRSALAKAEPELRLSV